MGFMDIEDFVERMRTESAGNHRVLPPLEDEELNAWLAKWPNATLPEDYLDLLRCANGVQFWVHEGSPHGYFQMLPLREVDTARQIMWGEALGHMDDDEVPYPHWFAITGHQDGACYIVLDPDARRYYLMDTCGADLTYPVGSSVAGLLDFIWHDWIEAMHGG
jgi:hypothetical protein